MGPLRIVILIILFYILYRLIVSKPGKRERSRGGNEPFRGTQPHDILEEDPVCHLCIPRRQAITVNSGGETFYFCSNACRKRFLEQQKEQ